MASPTFNEYTVPAGFTSMKAGRGTPYSGIPAWRTAMPPHTWAVVPTGNTLSSLNPALNPALNPNGVGNTPPWGGGHPGVLNAWGALTPSMNDGRVWIAIGGGHEDYGGNEAYVLDLMLGTPMWQLLHPPSGSIGHSPGIILYDGQEATGVYSDGRMRAVHAYGNSLHIPGGNIFVSCVSAPYPRPGGPVAPKSFWVNIQNGNHSIASDWTGVPFTSGGGEGGACYDLVRNCVYHIRAGNGTRMLKTDLATGITTTVGSTNNWTGSRSMLSYVPGHDVVAVCTSGGGNTGLMIYDPILDVWNRTGLVSGSPAAGMDSFPGYRGECWVPPLGGIASWNQLTNTAAISLLTPPASNAYAGTWTFSVLPLSGSNAVLPPPRPFAQAPNEKRFGYIPALNGFILKTEMNSSEYFYALS